MSFSFKKMQPSINGWINKVHALLDIIALLNHGK